MRLKERDVGFGSGIGRGLHHRQGIDDRRVRGGRKRSHDLHASVGQRVGLIDDTEPRLVTVDKLQGGADIQCLGKPVFNRVPNLKHLERRLAIFAGRDQSRIGDSQPAIAQRLRERKIRANGERRRTARACDKNQLVAKQIEPSLVLRLRSAR